VIYCIINRICRFSLRGKSRSFHPSWHRARGLAPLLVPSPHHLWHYGRICYAWPWTHVCFVCSICTRVSPIMSARPAKMRSSQAPTYPLHSLYYHGHMSRVINSAWFCHQCLIRHVPGSTINPLSHLTPPRLESNLAKLQFGVFPIAELLRYRSIGASGNPPKPPKVGLVAPLASPQTPLPPTLLSQTATSTPTPLTWPCLSWLVAKLAAHTWQALLGSSLAEPSPWLGLP
jgi:hypothetical protein